MSEFKVGDVVENVSDGGLDINVGERYTITGVYGSLIDFNDSAGHGRTRASNGYKLHSRAPETPPTTITHEGYTYNRGERVRPEWLKDGAWVINKENGELNQLIAGDPGYFRAVNKKTWHAFVLDFHPSMSVSDVFRPFTNADWKWGMWAEYKGEKVFVTKVYTVGAVISTPKEEHLTVLFSELTPTTAP